jgi:chromosomal replication initiation ATPase DnaA
LFFDYVAVCDRCSRIKGEKSVDEFKHHILDTVKKLQSQYEISLLFELGLVSKTNKHVMFYGERIGDILGADRDIVRNIKNQVAEFYNLSPKELDAPTRKREVVWARQVAHTFSKKKTNASLSFIAQEIGGLHHATILNSIRAVSNEYDTNPRKRKEIDFLAKIFDTVID